MAARKTKKEQRKKVTLRILRFDASKAEDASFEEFTIDAPQHFTLLDCLIHIKERVDGSLTFRRNCRNAICGSCAIRVNGQAVLACKEHIHDLAARYGKNIEVSALGNMAVIKDLVTEMRPFWEQYKAVRPWLITANHAPETHKENRMSPHDREKLVQTADCIQCGACYSDCNSVQVEPRFIGPAALAKAWRFVADTRDEGNNERLKIYEQPHGHWDCTHCFYCIEVCPMDVAPMEQILKLRRFAMDLGKKSTGQRHHDAFVGSIRKDGLLDELTLPLKSHGLDLAGQLSLIPVGVRMALHGKMPPLRHPKIENADEVRRVMHRAQNAGASGATSGQEDLQ